MRAQQAPGPPPQNPEIRRPRSTVHRRSATEQRQQIAEIEDVAIAGAPAVADDEVVEPDRQMRRVDHERIPAGPAGECVLAGPADQDIGTTQSA